MPSKFERLDVSEGWQTRALRDIRRKATEQRAAKRLPASDFGGVQTGAIPTDKLNQPSAPGFVNLSTSGFPVPNTWANVIVATVPVPAGFTSCVVSLAGRVYAYNSNAAPDYLYAQTVVNGASGNAFPVPAAAAGSFGESALNVATSAVVLSNLDTSITVEVWTKTLTAAWALNAANTADLTGTVVWFR